VIGRLSLLLLLCVGCAQTRRPVTAAFPPAVVAWPWILQEEVWSGSFDEAAPGLGEDAEKWREHHPTRVWLAIYRHERDPQRRLTVRCFAFESSGSARAAFESFRPIDAKAFDAGDAGCWSGVGVMFRWGRLVLEVFGPDASWSSETQSSLLATFLIKRMPAGAPEDPR
jgi:hypothetical protein